MGSLDKIRAISRSFETKLRSSSSSRCGVECSGGGHYRVSLLSANNSSTILSLLAGRPTVKVALVNVLFRLYEINGSDTILRRNPCRVYRCERCTLTFTFARHPHHHHRLSLTFLSNHCTRTSPRISSSTYGPRWLANALFSACSARGSRPPNTSAIQRSFCIAVKARGSGELLRNVA